MLVREVGVTVLRFWVIRHGVIPASRGGKVKTLLQAVAIGLYVLPCPAGCHVVAEIVMLAVAWRYHRRRLVSRPSTTSRRALAKLRRAPA